MFVGALVAHDTHGANGGEQDSACLPYLIIQGLAIGIDIFAESTDEDIVSVLQDAHLLRGDVAQDADSQART